MASKTFEELLNKLPEKDKAGLDQSIQGLKNNNPTPGQEVTTNDAPTSVPNKTADATQVTGYNTDIHDAAAAKGNSATVSEISNKPATQEPPQPTPEPDKDR